MYKFVRRISMDEYKNETNSLKHCLDGIQMHSCKVRGGSCETCTILSVEFRKYLQLKLNSDYTSNMFINDCELSLTITKKKRCTSVIFIIETDLTNMQKPVAAYVSYADDTLSAPVYLEQFHKDEYQVDFGSSVINDPRNEPLKSGELHLVFQFEVFEKLKRRIFPYTGSNIKNDCTHTFRSRRKSFLLCEEDVLSENLKKAFQDPKFGDYVILLESKKQFHVHKAVLAARSEYFSKWVCRKKNGMQLSETTSQAVGLLLEYLYCGKIKVTSLDDVIDVMELSVRVQIGSLLKLCVRNLKKRVCLYNANKILLAAESLSLEPLAKSVKDYKEKHKNVLGIMSAEAVQNS